MATKEHDEQLVRELHEMTAARSDTEKMCDNIWLILVKYATKLRCNVYGVPIGRETYDFIETAVDFINDVAHGNIVLEPPISSLAFERIEVALFLAKDMAYRANAWDNLFSSLKPSTKPKKQGYVYAIRNRQFRMLKFGYTANPKERLKNLSASAGVELQLLGTTEGTLTNEGDLLKAMEKHKIISEWFRSNAVTEAIADAIARGDSIESVLALARQLTTVPDTTG